MKTLQQFHVDFGACISLAECWQVCSQYLPNGYRVVVIMNNSSMQSEVMLEKLNNWHYWKIYYIPDFGGKFQHLEYHIKACIEKIYTDQKKGTV